MKISLRGITQALWDKVFKDIGIPKKILSDRGPQFVSNFMKELCLHLGIERNPSTTYHPQTDGQTVWQNLLITIEVTQVLANHYFSLI